MQKNHGLDGKRNNRSVDACIETGEFDMEKGVLTEKLLDDFLIEFHKTKREKGKNPILPHKIGLIMKMLQEKYGIDLDICDWYLVRNMIRDRLKTKKIKNIYGVLILSEIYYGRARQYFV